jgi:hypothetical protein
MVVLAGTTGPVTGMPMARVVGSLTVMVALPLVVCAVCLMDPLEFTVDVNGSKFRATS